MHKGKRMPALLYAHDIVLMGENESQLKKMLSIANHLVKKWSMEFNSNKSKVMVIGMTVDGAKIWMLGNT